MLPYRSVWAAVAVLIVAISVASSLHGCGDDDGTPCCAVCGDGVCGGDENNCNCSDDCASSRLCLAILPTCGDGNCEDGASPGESHERCPEDCPADCRPCASSPDPTRTSTSTATPTTTPTPIVIELFELPGTYDVSGDVHAFGTDAVAFVSVASANTLSIRIEVNTLDAFDLEGSVATDGSVMLTGHRILGGDAFVQAAGTATATVTDAERRISGMLTDSVSANPRTFSMVRPAAGTPTSLSGPYVFALDSSPSGCGCTSSSTLTLAVISDGTATFGTVVDVGASATVGTFSSGDCIVSSTSRVHCAAIYDPEAGDGGVSHFIRLHGTLNGTGDFLRGSPPSTLATGHWSASS